MFELAGLLSVLLSPSEAGEALTYTFKLFEPLHSDEDGDGPWRPTLAPPATVQGSVAGFLWAALGAPEATRRWEAAHCVCTLAALGQTVVLDDLMACAINGSGPPFTDDKLRFYELHARQWLLIGLARAALNSPATIARHTDFLKQLAQRGNLHVVLRHFAAMAMLSLEEQGAVTLDPKSRAALTTANQSRLPVIDSTYYDRLREGTPTKREWKDARFHFGIDFPKNYLSPLGRVFAISDEEMEIEAERVIRDDWGLEDDGRYDKDVRALRGYFNENGRRGRHSGPSDDLDFYLSYHATMTLAGKLLDNRQVHEDLQHPEDDHGTVRGWLRDQLLVRDDGYWLADRRDPCPEDARTSSAYVDESAWLSSLAELELLDLLKPESDRIVVAARWGGKSGRQEQRVKISSALVSPDKAWALARALEGVDPYSYAIPDYQEHGEISYKGFTLAGWLAEAGAYDGLDARDPWTADLAKRTDVPALPFRNLLSLAPSSLGRIWKSADEPALWSEVWSDSAEENSDWRQSGQRLIASTDAIERLLRDSSLSLLVELQVERRIGRMEYESYSREQAKAQTRTQIFIIEQAKEGITVGSGPGAGPQARQAA